MTLHITTPSKTGKMEGIRSINTLTLENPFCSAMRRSTSETLVCNKCYAAQLEAFRNKTQPPLKANAELLGSRLLTDRELPVIIDKVFRFSGFGELENETHFRNIINICRKNPDTFFSLWTKRAHLVRLVLLECGKPDNLNLIYSSPYLDTQALLPRGFDKVFTVYKTDPGDINCHGKCKDCLLCYSSNSVTHIHEMLKKPARRTTKQ